MQKSLKDSGGMGGWLVTSLGRVLISLIVPVITFVVLWQGFIFLRDSQAPKLIIVLVAIIWGVGGVQPSIREFLTTEKGERFRQHDLAFYGITMHFNGWLEAVE